MALGEMTCIRIAILASEVEKRPEKKHYCREIIREIKFCRESRLRNKFQIFRDRESRNGLSFENRE